MWGGAYGKTDKTLVTMARYSQVCGQETGDSLEVQGGLWTGDRRKCGGTESYVERRQETVERRQETVKR